MAKQSASPKKARTPEEQLERARRKVAKLQLKVDVAEEKQAQAQVRGKQEIEQARLRAAEWMTEAAERLERRRQIVARAEARVHELEGTMLQVSAHDGSSLVISSPTDAARAVASLAYGIEGLAEREHRALQALRDIFAGSPVTAAQWSAAAGLSRTTLARARDVLEERGLIRRDAADGQTIRYVPLATSADGS